MMKRLLVVLLFIGCAATQKPKTKDAVAAQQVTAALEALPTCAAGVDAGKLVVQATMCTLMACGGPSVCCNQCGWSATFMGGAGLAVPLEPARVREVLGLGQGSLECEVKAWGDALAEVSLSLGEPACVAR